MNDLCALTSQRKHTFRLIFLETVLTFREKKTKNKKYAYQTRKVIHHVKRMVATMKAKEKESDPKDSQRQGSSTVTKQKHFFDCYRKQT